jgi:hypothetical protein
MMRTFILFAALSVIAAAPVVAAAEAPLPKEKTQPANIYNSPFGSTSINRGFTDRHYEPPRKIDINKRHPAPAPDKGQDTKVMRGV